MSKKQKFNSNDAAKKVLTTLKVLIKQGGPDVYTQKVEGATNPKLLRIVLDSVVNSLENKVSVMLVSCCERNMYVSTYVPKNTKLSPLLWTLHVLDCFSSFKLNKETAEYSSGAVKCSGESSPFKMIDATMMNSFTFLKKEGLLTTDESDDEDYSSNFEW